MIPVLVPVEFGIWRVDGENTTPVTASALANEAKPEAILERDPSILGLDVLLVGRQVITSFGTRIDLLAVDSEGTLCIIEVKKARTPREVVAQALDYGYWVEALTLDDLATIHASHHDGQSFEDGFRERFDDDPPDALAGEHRLVIVASSLDPSTVRIVNYVRRQGVPIYVVFFQYFKDGEHEYLARTWDADPARSEGPPERVKKARPPWNGQDKTFTSRSATPRHEAGRTPFATASSRAAAASGTPRRSKRLFPGARIFTYIPQTGYVAVGTVRETAQPIKDFTIEVNGQPTPLLDAPLDNPSIGHDADNLELCDYVVGVDWIKTLPTDEAFWQKGMFANQNTAVRLRDTFTIERLTEAFALDSGES